MSPKHLQCYVNEFTIWHNVRAPDTVEQMEHTVKGLFDKEMSYKWLTRKTGLNATAT